MGTSLLPSAPGFVSVRPQTSSGRVKPSWQPSPLVSLSLDLSVFTPAHQTGVVNRYVHLSYLEPSTRHRRRLLKSDAFPGNNYRCCGVTGISYDLSLLSPSLTHLWQECISKQVVTQYGQLPQQMWEYCWDEIIYIATYIHQKQPLHATVHKTAHNSNTTHFRKTYFILIYILVNLLVSITAYYNSMFLAIQFLVPVKQLHKYTSVCRQLCNQQQQLKRTHTHTHTHTHNDV